MKRAKVAESSPSSSRFRPALSPENREGQLISLASDLAEKRLRDGTAKAQEVVYFLRLGSMRERENLEIERLRNENSLLQAKVENLKAQTRVEELYTDAIKAMQRYSGHFDEDDEEDEEPDY